jgi:dipeptidyl aminopeptidase/acylaminoacyl peptidase
MFPTFLPDGRHFLYFRTAESPTNSGIFLASLDKAPEQQPSKRLLGTPYAGAYLSNGDAGYLLFLSNTTLMAQRLDAQKLELQGEAVPVADRLGVYRQFPGFSLSSMGHLVYRSGGTGLYVLIWYDRQGKTLGTVGPAGTYEMASLSPDGSQVAVMRIDPKTQNQDIYLLDLARGIPTCFTFDPASDNAPVWSSDSRSVAFVSTRGGHQGIYKKLATGAGTEDLLYQGSQLFMDDWSRDGRLLLFSDRSPETKADLYTLPLDGSSKPTPVLKSTFNETQGQFSPDGR